MLRAGGRARTQQPVHHVCGSHRPVLFSVQGGLCEDRNAGGGAQSGGWPPCYRGAAGPRSGTRAHGGQGPGHSGVRDQGHSGVRDQGTRSVAQGRHTLPPRCRRPEWWGGSCLPRCSPARRSSVRFKGPDAALGAPLRERARPRGPRPAGSRQGAGPWGGGRPQLPARPTPHRARSWGDPRPLRAPRSCPGSGRGGSAAPPTPHRSGCARLLAPLGLPGEGPRVARCGRPGAGFESRGRWQCGPGGDRWFGAAPGGGRGGGSEVISALGRQRFESPRGQNRK